MQVETVFGSDAGRAKLSLMTDLKFPSKSFLDMLQPGAAAPGRREPPDTLRAYLAHPPAPPERADELPDAVAHEALNRGRPAAEPIQAQQVVKAPVLKKSSTKETKPPLLPPPPDVERMQSHVKLKKVVSGSTDLAVGHEWCETALEPLLQPGNILPLKGDKDHDARLATAIAALSPDKLQQLVDHLKGTKLTVEYDGGKHWPRMILEQMDGAAYLCLKLVSIQKPDAFAAIAEISPKSVGDRLSDWAAEAFTRPRVAAILRPLVAEILDPRTTDAVQQRARSAAVPITAKIIADYLEYHVAKQMFAATPNDPKVRAQALVDVANFLPANDSETHKTIAQAAMGQPTVLSALEDLLDDVFREGGLERTPQSAAEVCGHFSPVRRCLRSMPTTVK